MSSARQGCPHWAYQARRVATQANAAGGAVVIDISPAAGQAFRVVAVYGKNSGTNVIQCRVLDEDNAANTYLAYLGSAAANYFHLPFSGSTTTSSGNIGSSQGLMVCPGQKLEISQTGAGAQNDTLTVAVTLELIGSATEPTWSVARSTNAGDVTLAASTIGTNPIIFLGWW